MMVEVMMMMMMMMWYLFSHCYGICEGASSSMIAILCYRGWRADLFGLLRFARLDWGGENPLSVGREGSTVVKCVY